jgi:hypothetical protein
MERGDGLRVSPIDAFSEEREELWDVRGTVTPS